MTSDFASISVDLAREPDFFVGPVRVRPSLRQIESDGKSETLEPRVMQVLVALSHKRGEVVGRDELVQRCWAGRAVGEDAISRAITRVRKLGETYGAFTLETIPKVGYRLTSTEVAGATGRDIASTHAPETAPVPATDAPPAANSSRPRRTWALVAAGAAVAFLAGLGLWTLQGGKSAVASNTPRIAVLPFEVFDDSREALTLSRTAPAAIADALLTSGQEVIPPQQTAAYIGDKRRNAARDLKASYVIEGEVRSENGHAVLSARILDDEGIMIWKRRLEAADLAGAALPSQAGAAIAYRFRWLASVPAASDGTATERAAVIRSVDSTTGAAVLPAYEDARKAAETAGNKPFLYIAMIITGANALPEAQLVDRPRMLADMREALKKVEALMPGLSTVRLAQHALIPEADWAGRGETIFKGIDELPRTGIISGNYSNFLLQAGRAKESEVYARKHMSMEPTSPIGSTYLVAALLSQARYPAALTELDRVLQIYPDNGGLVQERFAALVWSGDFAGAEAMLAIPEAADAIEPSKEARPARAMVKALRTKSAADIAAFRKACTDTVYRDPSAGAICLSGFGQLGLSDDSFDLLDQVLPDLRGANRAEAETKWLEHPLAITIYAKLLMNPVVASLREDIRLIDVVERIGLLDYWKTSGVWPDFCETEPKSVCAAMKAQR
jgi:DNA-binding winged helix-turn-helix (wHTH) protein/TolB-like protein